MATGAALALLAARYPERELVGIDLSPGRTEVARRDAAANRGGRDAPVAPPGVTV